MEIMNIKIDMILILSTIALAAGIILYIAWGLTYDVWADIGIYSVTIILVAVGIIGILLSRENIKEN